MRLFVAIDIAPHIRSTIAAFIEEFRPCAPQSKWVRVEAMHITLKFLGEMPPSRLSAVESALASIRSDKLLTLEFRGFGFFPNEKHPRVFWIGMECSPNLKTLAMSIDQSLHKLGLTLEQRAYTPHLTLARFNAPGLPPKLADATRENTGRYFGSFTTNQFHLLESKLKSTGAEYTTLHSFSFGTEG
jgi:RNA 2',3'-cyclic 3'-phosphodiesterase